jgi:hypothetical protein
MRFIAIPMLASLLVSSCATVRSSPLYFGMTDFAGARRVAFYEGEAINLQINWEEGLDTGKGATCSIVGALDGKVLWKGLGTLPARGTKLLFDPPYPQEGLKPSIGAYITTCIFSNGGGQGSIQFSVSPPPQRDSG